MKPDAVHGPISPFANRRGPADCRGPAALKTHTVKLPFFFVFTLWSCLLVHTHPLVIKAILTLHSLSMQSQHFSFPGRQVVHDSPFMDTPKNSCSVWVFTADRGGKDEVWHFTWLSVRRIIWPWKEKRKKEKLQLHIKCKCSKCFMACQTCLWFVTHRRHTGLISWPMCARVDAGACYVYKVWARCTLTDTLTHARTHTHTHTHTWNTRRQSCLLSFEFLPCGGSVRHLNLHHAVRRNKHITARIEK